MANKRPNTKDMIEQESSVYRPFGQVGPDAKGYIPFGQPTTTINR